jgi:hypothetical protein
LPFRSIDDVIPLSAQHCHRGTDNVGVCK